MKRWLALAFAGVVAFALGLTAQATAQASPMVIAFTAPPSFAWADRVVVFVGETPCIEAHFRSNSTPTVAVGSDDQPASCRADGADVTFLRIGTLGEPTGADELFNRTIYVGGTRFEFVNWAPMPAVDPGPPGGPLPAYMRAYVESDPALRPLPMTIEFSNVSDAGPIDRLVVFVNGAACASAVFDAQPQPPLILAHESQPAACQTDGGTITFLQIYESGQAAQLFEEPILVLGATYQLINWAPKPPGTQLPTHMQTFLDSGATVLPAPGGNAGFATSEGAPLAAPLVLATCLLLIAARRLADTPD